MKGLQEYLTPYLISQAASLIFLFAAWKNTRLARWLFAALFLWASGTNMYLGITSPDSYLGNADLALPFYRDFINGWFSRYNHILIPLIAFGQFLIAIGMLLKGWWVKWACIGAIGFLLSIAPLMVGSAFPFSITVSMAALLILKKDSRERLWFSFEELFRKDVNAALRTSRSMAELLTEKDMLQLPEAVQKYIRYTGAIGRSKIHNMRVVFEGEMRSRKKDWFKFRSEQYNCFDEPARFFFMKAKMFGLSIPGYHRYKEARARMDIRLFGLISLVKKSGEIMDKTETVTLFNDICLMAPAALIDKRIQWQELDRLRVKALFTNGTISITAVLQFNETGELVNFFSDDRTDINDMRSYTFSTPCGQYKDFNGYRLQSEGDGVWHYPEGEFVYGHFRLKEIRYNVTEFK